MIHLRRPGLRTLLTASSAFVALAHAAQAQDITKTDPGVVSPAPAEKPATNQSTTTTLDAVVVTGSRIAKTGNASYAPIITVPAAAFQQTDQITLTDTLNRLPQFVGENTATSNDNLHGSIDTLSLHGLGSERTLVLLDGRRLTPALADGAVDISIIPQALLSNVEIITGGASTTYGSDAVAGVVNFHLNHNFTGLTISAQGGFSDRGDSGAEQVSIAGGGRFADDRGRFNIGLTYARRDALYDYQRAFASNGRPSSNFPQGAALANSGNPASQATIDAVFAKYGVPAGTVSPTSGLGLNNDGTLFQFNNTVANYRGPTMNYGITPSTLRYDSGSQDGLITPFNKYAAYGYGEYDLTPKMKVYAQYDFLDYTSAQTYPATSASLSVPVTNPFIPADLAQILASRPDPDAPFTLAKRYLQFGDRIGNYHSTDWDFTGGFKGALPFKDWTYDVYGSTGSVSLRRLTTGNPDTTAIETLLSAPGGGASICSGGYDFVGFASVSSSCAAYGARTLINHTQFVQTLVEGDAQGGVFTLPWAHGGEVRAAVGSTYRTNTYDYAPDPLLSDPAIISFGDGTTPAAGTVKVGEVYGEVEVPLLKDLPLVHLLSGDFGARYSNYNTSGGFVTWKASGRWQPINGLEFRGGYARAIRSPGADDLFTPQYQDYVTIGLAGPSGQGDPCDVNSAYRKGSNAAQVRALCLAQGVPASLIDSYTFGNSQLSTGVAGGNPNLQAEHARTLTAGVTFAPKLDNPFTNGMSVALDYYSIIIDGAVSSLQGQDVLQNCFNYTGSTNTSYSNNALYCKLLTRDPTTGNINYIDETTINSGRLATSGIDLTGRWRVGLDAFGLPARYGALTLNEAVGWLNAFTLRNLPTDPITNFAGSLGEGGIQSAHPRWKALTNLTYDVGPLELGVQWRYIDAMEDVGSIGVTDSGLPGVPSVSYFDFNARYTLNERYEFRFGVTNIADKLPPTYIDNVQANTDPETYDVVGRAFYFGVSAKF